MRPLAGLHLRFDDSEIYAEVRLRRALEVEPFGALVAASSQDSR